MSQSSRQSFFLTILLAGALVLAGCSAQGPKRVNGELVFDADSLVNMADSFAKTGDYGNALRLYRRAAAENPEHLDAKLGLARTYRVLGAAEASVAVYQSVLELDPGNAEAQLGISQLLIRQNKPEEALDYLSQITGPMMQDYRYYNIRGLAHDLKGDHEQAQLTYGTGLNHDPDNISLLNNLGLSFAIEGQFAPAIRILSKAANLDVNNKTALQNLVMAYALSGEQDAAREMASTFMSEEEIPTSFQFYHWLSSLTSKQRAQAIFLGLRTFPEEEKPAQEEAMATAPLQEAADEPEEPLDPKKKKLLEILKAEQQTTSADELPAEHTQAAGIVEKAPSEATPVQEKAVKQSVTAKVYRVQLGSYPTEKLALDGWNRLQKKSGDILQAYGPLTGEVARPDGSVLHRLYVSDVEEKAEARDLCSRLKEQDVDCLVIYTAR